MSDDDDVEGFDDVYGVDDDDVAAAVPELTQIYLLFCCCCCFEGIDSRRTEDDCIYVFFAFCKRFPAISRTKCNNARQTWSVFRPIVSLKIKMLLCVAIVVVVTSLLCEMSFDQTIVAQANAYVSSIEMQARVAPKSEGK